jgi:5-methyltetrahydrofolate--homocysteine methyltransferase
VDFAGALREKVLIFDGAMGSSIHKYDLSLDDYQGYENCPEILAVSRPEIIQEIHSSFYAVGCDVVETNTFGGSPIVLQEFALADRAYELNLKAAQLAVDVARSFGAKGHKRYVSGSIGPTTKIPSLGHISFAEMHAAYLVQVEGLFDGGVDCLQFETGQDLLQAKAAILACCDIFKKKGRKLPVITQVTLEAPPMGTMLVGTDITAALTTLSSFPIDVIGINCATGPLEMLDPVQYLCRNTDLFVSVLPNAGLPENINDQTVYRLKPEELAQSLKYFVERDGVNIVGGCCGTTPEHLKAVVDTLGNRAPLAREVKAISGAASIYTALSYEIENPPLIVGERANTNGSKKFKELLEAENLDGMVSLARAQEREGAHILDVCTAYVGRDEIADMERFLRRLNNELQAPVMIDTTEFSVLEVALPLLAGKPIVNSINLEDGVDKMLRKIELISRYGASAVALTIDEKGMAKSAERKLEIAQRIYDLCAANGMKAQDIIFDALTFTLSTGNDEDRTLGLETLEAIKAIKDRFPGVRTILGVSNISFGFDPKIRRILNSVFLHHAVEAGLDMAIVNAQKILPLYKISEEEVALHNKLISNEVTAECDPLFTLLDFYRDKAGKGESKSQSKAKRSIEEILKARIVDGARVGLEDDLKMALERYAPLSIINEILLDGMKTVGELFGAGKMQLPFVLQSAETMKAAVSFLEPLLEKKEGGSRGTMVLATVKGDVHDIGKNLVDIILSNNGYKVVNLGIKQPIENIIQAFQEHKASCIGMSGLLVKSTVVMKENLEILNRHGITAPVILGGAALTRRYVEEDCRRVYKGTIYYGQDAFDDLRYMEEFAAQENQEKNAQGTDAKAQCKTSAGSSRETQTQAELRSEKKDTGSNAVVVSRQSTVPKDTVRSQPPFWGTRVLGPENFSLAEIFSYINEVALIKGQFRVRQGELSKGEYAQLLEEKIYPVLTRLKAEVIEKKLLSPRAVYGYFPCRNLGDSLQVFHPGATEGSFDGTELEPWVSFHFPRQNHGRYLNIADFFLNDKRLYDVLPLQIVTMGEVAASHAQELFAAHNYADYLYFHGLAVESAEGLAELVHKTIRAELGFASFDATERARLFQQGYRGTRFGFGYPACPDLEEQGKLFTLLDPSRIGISLTEEFQLVPEQSTTGLVVVHPQAKYFNIDKAQQEVTVE